ncbi:MAG TPA: PEP-CTERM sorting domain-containing protein [Verrucomicrobiae bacterium]|nr:PEP-CTERM sorting domain-containing protein [Verrucomicrobiae bacterium]
MKKTAGLLAMIAGVLMMGMSSAYAVPVINGAIAPATEWNNTGYNYYLNVSDVNEALIPDQYDIKNVTLLQEIEGFGFGDSNAANDGIYLLVETYAAPSFVDETLGGPKVTVFLDADFNNDGIIDFSMEHTANANGTGQKVTVTFNVFGPTGDLVTNGGSFSTGSVIEYYIPHGPFNTPNAPFPISFVGYITYDNGGLSPDDNVTGGPLVFVPEPSTMLLFGGALLGMIGLRFKK